VVQTLLSCDTRVYVGCQQVWWILLHGVVHIFSHPTPSHHYIAELRRSSVHRVWVNLMYSTAWCGIYIRTPYSDAPHITHHCIAELWCTDVCRVSVSLMYSTASCGIYILTPYASQCCWREYSHTLHTSSYPHTLHTHLWYHAAVRTFSHPTHLVIVSHTTHTPVLHVFEHPTHTPMIPCCSQNNLTPYTPRHILTPYTRTCVTYFLTPYTPMKHSTYSHTLHTCVTLSGINYEHLGHEVLGLYIYVGCENCVS